MQNTVIIIQQKEQIFKKMSLKATIDMFVNFSYIQVRFLNRQGFIRYRMKIFMKYQGKQVICSPYNIVKGPTTHATYLEHPKSTLKLFTLGQSGMQAQITLPESQIDNNTLHYYSRIIQISYRPNTYQENQTVFFKCYINTQLLEDIEYYCTIQCMFSENLDAQFQVVGKFQSKIRKIYGISTFLPVVFDVFEGFMIFSTFHATVLEVKYSEDDFQSFKLKKDSKKSKPYTDFFSYLDSITNQFSRKQLQKFYEYYRYFLIKQGESIQNRHSELLQKIKKQLHYKLQIKQMRQYQQRFQQSTTKILKNLQLLKLICGKSIYQPQIALDSLNNDNNDKIQKNQEKDIIVEMIVKDYTLLKGHLYKKWMQFVKFVIQYSKYIAKCLRKQYQILCKERFKNNVFSHKIKNHDWRISKYEDSGKINLEQAFTEKKKTLAQQQLWKDHFPIQNMSFFGKSSTNIKIFQQVYLRKSESSQTLSNSLSSSMLSNSISYQPVQSKPRHIVILVHGFQASRQDFILFKNCLQVSYGIHVIISTCNQGLTESSIIQAGKRLANQVRKIFAMQSGQFRISFVGHSMGGLIIRSAVPQLENYKEKFYAFISFSTPHLGYLYESSALVKAGLWILSAWHKIQAVKQLSMKDNTNLRETVLYTISKSNSLKSFKKICLISSSQDQYVAYESARIQINKKILAESIDKNTQEVIKEMVDNILGNIDCEQVSRINVIFNIQNKFFRNLDSFLGRTGHVKFLSDVQFIREFCACFEKLFA